jgi:hypothetical protein
MVGAVIDDLADPSMEQSITPGRNCVCAPCTRFPRPSHRSHSRISLPVNRLDGVLTGPSAVPWDSIAAPRAVTSDSHRCATPQVRLRLAHIAHGETGASFSMESGLPWEARGSLTRTKKKARSWAPIPAAARGGAEAG